MKEYKIGSLPFIFNSRKQVGEFTVFGSIDGSIEIKIKTDVLNKNTGIFKDEEVKSFAETSLGGITVNAEEFVGKLNDEIAKQKIENLGAVVDNTGAIVISNAETEEECVINGNSAEDIEAFLKFVIENGLSINGDNIENFAEMTHFGLGTMLKGDGFNRDKSVKVGKSIDNVTNKNNPDKLEATKILAPLSSNLAQFKVNIDSMIKRGAGQVDKKLEKVLTELSKNYEGLYNNIENIKEKHLNGDSFLAYKKKEENLLKNAKIDTTEAEKKANNNNKEDKLKEIETEFKDIKATYDRAKKEDDKEKMKSCVERVKKLKEEKAKLVNMSEVNFDANKREQAINNYKKQLADVLGKHKAFLAAQKQAVESASFKSGAWQKFGSSLLKKLNTFINTIEGLDTKYELSLAQEKINELAKKLVEEQKTWDDEIDSIKQEETKSKKDNNELVSRFNEATGLSLNSNEKNEAILKKAIEGDSEAQKQIRGVLENKGLSEEKIMEVIGKLKGDTNESGFDFSEAISNVFSEKITNFDAHQVKDSEFGVAYEDRFGSLWSDNPDENPYSDLLWESANGKEQPTKGPVEDESGDPEADEGVDEESLEGGDDESLEGDEEPSLDDSGDEESGLEDGESGDESLDTDENGGDSLDFSENDGGELSLDLDSEGDGLDLDSEGDSDGLDLESEGDDPDLNSEEPDIEEEQETISAGENLNKALDVIKSMYITLADKIK